MIICYYVDNSIEWLNAILLNYLFSLKCIFHNSKINEVSIYADTMTSQLDINDIIKAMQ